MLNMNNTNYEAFGAFKKNNLISRTCTVQLKEILPTEAVKMASILTGI